MPDNYLISTGQTRSLEEFVDVAFSLVGLDWREHVVTSELYYRPTDIMKSYTDPTKAQKKLGWKAETMMEGVVQRMLQEDIT